MKQLLCLTAVLVAAVSAYGAAAPAGKDAAVPAKSQKNAKAAAENKAQAPVAAAPAAAPAADAKEQAPAAAPAADAKGQAPAAAPADGKAQAPAAEAAQNPAEGRRGMGGRFMEQLKEKYPAEVAEIEKLRQSDPAAARAKTRELMQKAGIGMGRRGGMMRERGRNGALQPTPEQLEELKAKAPNEFAEYEKLKISNPERAAVLMEGMMASVLGIYQKNLRDNRSSGIRSIKAELKKMYPEEYAEYEKLNAIDPDAGRKKIRELYKKSGLKGEFGSSEVIYEYQDPKNPNNRNNMQQRMFPGGRGGFGGFGGFRGRQR